LDEAKPAAGVLDAISEADLILLAPSNPVVSIGTILNVSGVRAAIETASAPVIGLSPIIGGAPVRGMADACLPVIGVETSAEGVGRWYGPSLLDGWLIHSADAADIPGVAVLARELYMADDEVTAAMTADAVRLAGLER
jgi:LPPG:FO 2-phospho-L-lactate transferase